MADKFPERLSSASVPHRQTVSRVLEVFSENGLWQQSTFAELILQLR
jgi:hypothetical protein